LPGRLPAKSAHYIAALSAIKFLGADQAALGPRGSLLARDTSWCTTVTGGASGVAKSSASSVLTEVSVTGFGAMRGSFTARPAPVAPAVESLCCSGASSTGVCAVAMTAVGSSITAGSETVGSACSCAGASTVSAAGASSATASFTASIGSEASVSGSAKAALSASEEATSTAGAACSADAGASSALAIAGALSVTSVAAASDSTV